FGGDEGGIAIRKRTDIFQQNETLIAFDFNLLTQDAPSGKITDPHSRIYGADNLYVSEGVDARAVIINAEDGPIYLGKNVTLSEGAIIKGTHGFCNNSFVAMGGKMRGGSTIGPYAKAGGEVSNSVIMGYSNKAHEGYMGNSVLGYWCNLGAGTNTSNLKNNYTEVKSWSYVSGSITGVGADFCGLVMGDHSKCGIDTMLNSGTVIGVSANVFGGGYQPKFIPSFSWGGE
ncbi:glucose-1-phosphate thymidylyltransferase, partial [bacterium]|nr:glucose-1-phosphate thymidylyltransferase [bacterium]